MNILHVRSVPDDLYQRLKHLAETRNRSLSAQVLEMLSQKIEEEDIHLQQIASLNAIHRRRFKPPENSPTSLQLIKEDRSR